MWNDEFFFSNWKILLKTNHKGKFPSSDRQSIQKFVRIWMLAKYLLETHTKRRHCGVANGNIKKAMGLVSKSAPLFMVSFFSSPANLDVKTWNDQILTLGRTRGGGGGWIPYSEVFLSVILEDKTRAPDVFSSCSFIPCAHFETSSVIRGLSYPGFQRIYFFPLGILKTDLWSEGRVKFTWKWERRKAIDFTVICLNSVRLPPSPSPNSFL